MSSVLKRPLGVNVLDAAQRRIAWTFDTFPIVYVSFSGGKDSSVMLHLVAAEARRQGRRFGLMFIDLEAQYKLTIEHVAECFQLYADLIDPFWIALPIHLRNAVSMLQPYWQCWEPAVRSRWVREPHPLSITDGARFPFFRIGMEFEEFIADFGDWYGDGQPTACFVGIRSDESLNRFRTLIAKKTRFEGRSWTTWKGRAVFNVYPIYDWRTEDLWTYVGREDVAYNRLYDMMHLAGLTPHQMRICQPYGDDQRKGLHLYHLIEPESWARVVARVSGANYGAIYCGERGNVLGNHKVEKPDGQTWQQYARIILDSLPPDERDHYEDKIAVFLNWYALRGYPEGIPDEADMKLEAARKVPSWRRIVKVLLKNDKLCKGLSFGQQLSKPTAHDKYKKVMKKRRQRWQNV